MPPLEFVNADLRGGERGFPESSSYQSAAKTPAGRYVKVEFGAQYARARVRA